MKALKIIAAGLVLVFALGLLTGFAQQNAQKPKDSKKPAQKPQEKIFIPKEIKAIIQEGLATRQGRQDIPFTIFQHFIFPAPDSLHTVLFFRAKNSDLGFGAPAPSPAPKPGEAQPQTPPPPAGALEARFNVFLEYFQIDAAGASKDVRENYCPVTLQEDSATYKPDAEEWYTISQPLKYGKYTVAIAITSLDLKKVGVGYYDFVLQGPEAYQNALETTQVFFVKKMEQMQSPEMRTTLHKGMFTYSVLQVVPNLESIVAPGAQIEIFYYIFGAKPRTAEPGQQPKNDIEAEYTVQKEDGALAIRWAPSTYDFALVSQPLPLKQTVQISDEKGGKRTEQRDLGAGKYNLVIKIKDKISGLTLEKKLPFEVKAN